MLPNYDKGDITLLNTIYHKSKKNDSGKYGPDYISLIYKNNTTLEKEKITIKNPKYTYYKVKDEYLKDYNELFYEKDKVESKTVLFKDLLKDIAKETGNLDFFYDNLKSNNSSANRYLHTNTMIVNSDMDINDYYKKEFIKKFGFNSELPLTKSYLDIEVDGIDLDTFPMLGQVPINAVTIIDGTSNNVYTLLLVYDKNPNSKSFMKSYMDDKDSFEKELRKHIEESVRGWKNAIRYGLDKLKFNLFFYEEEINLIKDLFKMINKTKPDFILAWNMAFDIPYIIERIKVLGYDPKDIICHPDFDIKECYYYIDQRNESDLSERGDFAKISSYSIFLDQMIHFASRRKGQSAFRRFNLDYIGGEVANVQKYDYSHITQHMPELPYKDYNIFVIYNIIDTIVQKCIELKTEDIDYVFTKASINCTRYEKCHRNTIYLKNRATISFYEDSDVIIGNNCNLQSKPEKYPGAIVGDPLLVQAKTIKNKEISLRNLRVYDNNIDYDYKALYPSLILELRLLMYHIIGKIIIDDHSFNFNEFNDEDFDIGGYYLQDFIARNWVILLSKWYNLANYKELIYDVKEYLISKPNTILDYRRVNGKIDPIITVDKINKIEPIYFDKRAIKPILFDITLEVKKYV